MTVLNSVAAAQYVGCSYRQLDYWIRIGHIPEDTANGSGSQRHWTIEQIRLAQVFYIASNIGMRLDIIAEYAQEVTRDLRRNEWIFDYDRVTLIFNLPSLPKEWLKDERIVYENLSES